MKRPHRCSGAMLLVGCYGIVSRTGNAFVVTLPFRELASCTSTSFRRAAESTRPGEKQRLKMTSSWSSEERTELIRVLAQWQERDEIIGAAGVKILTESSPTAVLTRYYDSLAAGEDQQVVLVAPSCTVEGEVATMVERALSSVCVSRVYHPEAEEGTRRAPHLALFHEEAAADIFSPSSVLSEQTASLSKSAVMEEVFLWLQRMMLGMVDDEEETFVDLGRKLLTVHKYVVVNATTEADLSRTFWEEATELMRHGRRAIDKAAQAEGEVVGSMGVGGGGDPREDSILLALPGFRFKDRASFAAFVEDKLAGPLKTLSPIGAGGVELFADSYVGEELKFPVIIVSPYLQKFEVPEGGYKFINGRGEEQDADEYIRESEKKLAQQAAERMAQQEANPLFPPPFPPIDDEDLNLPST